jgi:cephalosporin-C deacetylase
MGSVTAMATIDWPLEQLESYRPALTREPDFVPFWEAARAELAAVPIRGELERLEYPCDYVEVSLLRFASVGGQAITAWYLLPLPVLRSRPQIPAVAVYHGYGGSRGRVSDHLHWTLQGCAVLAMDTRGQAGDTPDRSVATSGQMTGRMTQGILDPHTYYYRGVYLDALRAVEWLRSRPEVDPDRIVATGLSQGGGLTLAVAALDRRLAAALPEVPYLCHFRRAVDVHLDGPYRELIEYLKRRPEHVAAAFRTLSYFDAMNLAPDVRCPVLCSVGLLDTICPPSTVYAAFNHLAGPREMRVYPFNGHVDGASLHVEEKYRFLRQVL